MHKINPFKPQSPIGPGMFIGRETEILRLENQLFQTRAGNPSNFMLTGERGIGKSSLLLFLNYLATGRLDPIEGSKLNFLVIDTDIDINTTQLALIKKIELGLRMSLGNTESIRKFFLGAWDFLQRIEAAGVKINPKTSQSFDATFFDEFTYAFSNTVKRITSAKESTLINSSYEGVLITIDEADKASPLLQLGSFLKLLSERLQRQDCNKVMFGLAGLPTLRKALHSSHESSLRIFDELLLDRLSDNEVKDVIDRCLFISNEENKTPTTISDAGRTALVNLSEGYPHFIQQFGYSAFEADSNNEIDETDVLSGAFDEHGALDQIGDRYYRDNFYNKIQKESYRQVLRIMADKSNDWISKDEIRKNYKGSEKELSNALQTLRARQIILSKEGERGIYRLQHKGFAIWIKLNTIDRSSL